MTILSTAILDLQLAYVLKMAAFLILMFILFFLRIRCYLKRSSKLDSICRVVGVGVGAVLLWFAMGITSNVLHSGEQYPIALAFGHIPTIDWILAIVVFLILATVLTVFGIRKRRGEDADKPFKELMIMSLEVIFFSFLFLY